MNLPFLYKVKPDMKLIVNETFNLIYIEAMEWKPDASGQ